MEIKEIDSWEKFYIYLGIKKLHIGKYLYKSSFGGQALLDCIMDENNKIATTDIDLLEDGDSGEPERIFRVIENNLSCKTSSTH